MKINEGEVFKKLQALNRQNEMLKENLLILQKIFDSFLISITLEYGVCLDGTWEFFFPNTDVIRTLNENTIRVINDVKKGRQVVKVTKRKTEE